MLEENAWRCPEVTPEVAGRKYSKVPGANTMKKCQKVPGGVGRKCPEEIPRVPG